MTEKTEAALPAANEVIDEVNRREGGEQVDAEATFHRVDAGYTRILTLTLATLLVGIAAIAGYVFWQGKPASGFAVVDINSVVKIKEAEFTALLSRPGVGDKERVAAYQLVSHMGPEIERAVDELQKECACVIIVKSAVIAGPAEDLTPQLKEKLGMINATKGGA